MVSCFFIYIYASCYGGYVTHVADRRYIFKEPLPESVDIKDFNGWLKRFKKVFSMLDDAELVPIGLPYDGRSFYDETLEGLLTRVKELKQLGYNVPSYVITKIKSDIARERRWQRRRKRLLQDLRKKKRKRKKQ